MVTTSHAAESQKKSKPFSASVVLAHRVHERDRCGMGAQCHLVLESRPEAFQRTEGRYPPGFGEGPNAASTRA